MNKKFLNWIVISSVLLLGIFAANAADNASGPQIPPDPFKSRSYVFSDKLNRTTPFIGLKEGAVKELYNVRRPAPGTLIGWTCRGGTTNHNTTAISATTVEHLSQYINDQHNINMFVAQVNNALYQSDIIPPATGTSFGSSIYSLTSGSSAAFTDHINDDWVGAASGTTPWAYSGGTTYPDAFKVQHNTVETIYDDGYSDVRDTRDDTYILFVEKSGVSEVAYVGYRRRLQGVYLDFLTGHTNTATSGVSVYAWRDGAWTQVSNVVDNTAEDATGVTTFYKSGSITWDSSAADDPLVLPKTDDHLFWYKIYPTGDVTDGILVKRVLVKDYCQAVTNLWSGYYDIALGTYKSSSTGYLDYSGEVSDGTDVDYVDLDGLTADTQSLYIGCAAPIFAIQFKLSPDYVNDIATGCTIEYWDASLNDWAAVSGTTTDTTANNGIPLCQSGVIQWDGTGIDEDKRQLGGKTEELYWYKITYRATLDSDSTDDEIRVWEISYAQKPETHPPMPHYAGVAQYNMRAIWWPGYKNKNAIDYSQENYPHILNGPKAGSTGPIFGPGTINAVTRIHSWAIVSTRNPYRLYVLQGKVPGRFDEYMISDRIGVVAPHTLLCINDNIKLFSTIRSVHSGIFMGLDGFYLTDGRTVINISAPISDYFDTSSAPYIEPAYAHLSYGWIDYQERTVHFAVPMNLTGSGTQSTCNVELPYAYLTDEWYDIFARNDPAACGTDIVGSDNQRMAYIGDYAGKIYRTNIDTSDCENAISHYVVTTDYSPLAGERPDVLNYSCTLRGIKVKAKAKDSGDIDITTYPDDSDTGTTSTSGVSLAKSGYGLVYGKVVTNLIGETFSHKFASGSTVNEIMEIYGWTVDYYPERETQVQ